VGCHVSKIDLTEMGGFGSVQFEKDTKLRGKIEKRKEKIEAGNCEGQNWEKERKN
jgi:hypothetical protein